MITGAGCFLALFSLYFVNPESYIKGFYTGGFKGEPLYPNHNIPNVTKASFLTAYHT